MLLFYLGVNVHVLYLVFHAISGAFLGPFSRDWCSGPMLLSRYLYAQQHEWLKRGLEMNIGGGSSGLFYDLSWRAFGLDSK